MILAVAISLAIFYGSNAYISDQASPWAKALSGLATAILTAGTLGLLFEYVNKQRLIEEVVRDAVGQTRSIELGLSDIRLKVSEIDYRRAIRSSRILIVGSRYSSSFLDRHKDEVRDRLLKRGLSMKVLHMKDASIFPSTRGVTSTAEDFFKAQKKFDPKICANVKVVATDAKLCYNFVQIDDGIWVKMYFNAPQQELPPAFFVKDGSPLFASIKQDIDLLVSGGSELKW
jgi:hypothetical protein